MIKHIVKCCWIILFSMIISLIGRREAFAAPYYQGKVIRIIVGVAVGGGYDRMARLLAHSLPKYIPGKPSIVVENMPGATGMIAVNHIFNVIKPDGLTIGTFNRGLPTAQLLKAEGVKFDLTKCSWIGSTAAEPIVLTLRSDMPYKSVDDLRKMKSFVYLGGSGTGDASTQFPILLKEFLKLNLEIINYTGSAEAMLAVERKEVIGRAGSYSTLRPYIERGLLAPPIIRGRVSAHGIENIPVDEDLTTDKLGKTIMVMRSSMDLVGRPYIAPPGVPVEIMNILRTAFAKVVKEPEVREYAKQNQIEVEYLPAGECLKVLQSLFTQPKDVIKEFSKYVKF